MSNADRSRVMHLSEARARIPCPANEHAVSVLQRGTLDVAVALSIPAAPTRQTPHTQDEPYVVIRCTGFLLHDGKREPFEAGDLFIRRGWHRASI